MRSLGVLNKQQQCNMKMLFQYSSMDHTLKHLWYFCVCTDVRFFFTIFLHFPFHYHIVYATYINNERTEHHLFSKLQKDDPLKRIQEEINEVERRERELREKKLLLSNLNDGFPSTAVATPISDSIHSASMNDKDSNDSVSAMSDDSGISSSSSPINGQSSNPRIVPKYVRSQTLQNGSNVSDQVPLKLVRTKSTPHIFIPGAGRFNANPAQKGIMQRFIASRGRIGNTTGNNTAAINGSSPTGLVLKNADSFLVSSKLTIISNFIYVNLPIGFQTSMELNRPPAFAMSAETAPPIIERDEDGRPVRRGYVPVEEKIQKELRDMRSRETELKRIRRSNNLRKSQPDLLDDIDDAVE